MLDYVQTNSKLRKCSSEFCWLSLPGCAPTLPFTKSGETETLNGKWSLFSHSIIVLAFRTQRSKMVAQAIFSYLLLLCYLTSRKEMRLMELVVFATTALKVYFLC